MGQGYDTLMVRAELLMLYRYFRRPAFFGAMKYTI